VAEDTSEENVSRRRRTQPPQPPRQHQLELVPTESPYTVNPTALPRAAETSPTWSKPALPLTDEAEP